MSPTRDRSLLVAIVAVAASTGGGAAFAIDALRSARVTPSDPERTALAAQRASLPPARDVTAPTLPHLKRPRRPKVVQVAPSTLVVARPAAVKATPKSSPSPSGGESESEGANDD